jgi:hypothetical protein
MALTMRPTGLGAGIDKDRPDYTVYSGGWAVGRIYETRGGPDHLRWFWSLTVDPPMARSDKVATRLDGLPQVWHLRPARTLARACDLALAAATVRGASTACHRPFNIRVQKTTGDRVN